MTTKTLCSMGTYLKFVNCTHGQIIKFFWYPGRYASLSRCLTLAPSRYAMLDRKRPMLTGAKRNWSHATRARMVPFLEDVFTLRTRNSYHFVAAGPKMTVWVG